MVQNWLEISPLVRLKQGGLILKYIQNNITILYCS
uniref:Uncharacterized protein n=1 Tax=Arundo donax TaxID=35708 RepID=A0A0A9HJ84_ARUDO